MFDLLTGFGAAVHFAAKLTEDSPKAIIRTIIIITIFYFDRNYRGNWLNKCFNLFVDYVETMGF